MLCRGLLRLSLALLIVPTLGATAYGQRSGNSSTLDDYEFGPVMRAYLGYLRNEQEVVDDRVSRREISASYYRRNSNRIRALRQVAIRLARETGNDYVPELEAVTAGESGTIFEKAPRFIHLRPNEIVANKFRFLARANTGEVFYVFARLDPYEQAALIEQQSANSARSTVPEPAAAKGQRVGQSAIRPRRAVPR